MYSWTATVAVKSCQEPQNDRLKKLRYCYLSWRQSSGFRHHYASPLFKTACLSHVMSRGNTQSWPHPRSKDWHILDYVLIRDKKDMRITRCWWLLNQSPACDLSSQFFHPFITSSASKYSKAQTEIRLSQTEGLRNIPNLPRSSCKMQGSRPSTCALTTFGEIKHCWREHSYPPK